MLIYANDVFLISLHKSLGLHGQKNKKGFSIMESNALDITDHLHFTVSRSLSSRLCVWYSKNERVKEVGRNFHVICLLFPRWTLLLWFCSSVTWKLVRLVFAGCGMKKVGWIFLCVFCLSCNFMDWLIGLWFFFLYKRWFDFFIDLIVFYLSLLLHFRLCLFRKKEKKSNINEKVRVYSLSKCSLKCQFLLSCVRRVMIIFSRSVSMCFVHCSIDGFLNNRGWMFVNGFCMFWFCWLCNRSKTNNGYT